MNQKSILPVSLLLLAAACGGIPDAYTVKGDIPGADGTTVYLMKLYDDSMETDSVVVSNGEFIFDGIADDVTDAAISTKDGMALTLVIEPGDIRVSSIEKGDFSNARVSGTPTNDALYELFDEVLPMRKRIDELSGMAYGNPALADSIDKEIDAIHEQDLQATLRHIERNPDSYYFARNIGYMIGKVDKDRLKDVFYALSPAVRERLPKVKAYVDSDIQSAEPGLPAPPLSGKNLAGETESLADLKGKIVFVDFWSTTCGQCIAYFPRLKELYDKYHDRGFEVFCVGCDYKRDKWEKYVNNNKDGIKVFHHILNGSAGDDDGSELKPDQTIPYKVQALPTKYLIDRDGNVIGKFDKAEEIEARLEEIFN